MGGILLRTALKQKIIKKENTIATVKNLEQALRLSAELDIVVDTDNAKLARQSNLVLLAVKPNIVMEVIKEIRPEMNSKKLLISVAASVSTQLIEEELHGETPVVRAMPNTPCSVKYGMTGLCKGRYASEENLNMTREFFDAVGLTVVVKEEHMDAVTGLSGSGPAFIYLVLESLIEAGVKIGLPRDVAIILATQTTRGAAQVVLDTGIHPALLKDAVITPGGCTIDGILALKEGKLRATLIKAVVKAKERASKLLIN